MALIELKEVGDLHGPARDIANAGAEQYGQILLTWRALMVKPDLFAAYLPFLHEVVAPGELDMKIKDLSALLVAKLNHCTYTVSHRVASALRNGIAARTIQQTVLEEWEEFDPRLKIALELTKEMTLETSQRSRQALPYGVRHETRRRARDAFSDVELLELTFSISIWNALSRFHIVMDFEVDMPEGLGLVHVD